MTRNQNEGKKSFPRRLSMFNYLLGHQICDVPVTLSESMNRDSSDILENENLRDSFPVKVKRDSHLHLQGAFLFHPLSGQTRPNSFDDYEYLKKNSIDAELRWPLCMAPFASSSEDLQQIVISQLDRLLLRCERFNRTNLQREVTSINTRKNIRTKSFLIWGFDVQYPW